MKGQQRHHIYIAETNRAKHDSIRLAVSILERRGIRVTRIAHLTSVLLERPSEMTWSEFKDVIRTVPQPRIGSVLLTSCKTGRAFLCDNRGNQPGVFQRIA